jgi:putative tryptophan/tyrosine transport system substrate-binding protein
MKRRTFITLLGGAAAMWPPAARGQDAQRVARIGILLVAGPGLMGPFREALADLGYVDGKNIQFEVRSAQGQTKLLPELAAELVQSAVDIIVAAQTPAIMAAKAATRDIPIIMAPAGNPIENGLVASLARPGGNITGVAATSAELAAKSLELVLELAPNARRVGVLGNAEDPFVKPFFEEIQKGAMVVRLDVQPIMIYRSDELEGAFAAMIRERVDAVIVQPSLPVKLTIDLALKYRLPSLSLPKSDVEAGRLASYGGSLAERGRQIAGYIEKILKGTKPADLPVQQPTKFEIAINLKTAKALGLTIPPTLLARADEVIE